MPKEKGGLIIINDLFQEKDRLHHWHSLLVKWIIKIGDESKKKHGSFWYIKIDNILYRVDDYSYALSLSGLSKRRFWKEKKYFEFSVGIESGGFKTYWDEFQYRYHLGIVYKEWLKRRK